MKKNDNVKKDSKFAPSDRYICPCPELNRWKRTVCCCEVIIEEYNTKLIR